MFQELSSFKLGTAGLVGEISFGTTKDRSGGRRQTIEGKFEFGKAGRYYQWSRGRGLSHVSFPSKCLWLSTTQILELRNILGVRPPTIWKNKLLSNEYLGDFMHFESLFFSVWKFKSGKFHPFLKPSLKGRFKKYSVEHWSSHSLLKNFSSLT